MEVEVDEKATREDLNGKDAPGESKLVFQ